MNDSLKAIELRIAADLDVAFAALVAKDYAKKIGFAINHQYMISTAVSELARNIFIYAQQGNIYLNTITEQSKRGICVIAIDEGPGIEHVEKAMRDHYSTGGTMGVGLPGAKRLMDSFQIDSKLGNGTTVEMVKWI